MKVEPARVAKCGTDGGFGAPVTVGILTRNFSMMAVIAVQIGESKLANRARRRPRVRRMGMQFLEWKREQIKLKTKHS